MCQLALGLVGSGVGCIVLYIATKWKSLHFLVKRPKEEKKLLSLSISFSRFSAGNSIFSFLSFCLLINSTTRIVATFHPSPIGLQGNIIIFCAHFRPEPSPAFCSTDRFVNGIGRTWTTSKSEQEEEPIFSISSFLPFLQSTAWSFSRSFDIESPHWK